MRSGRDRGHPLALRPTRRLANALASLTDWYLLTRSDFLEMRLRCQAQLVITSLFKSMIDQLCLSLEMEG